MLGVKPLELRENPKALTLKRRDETSSNVNAAKAEKSSEMIYGEILSIIAMGYLQGSFEQKNLQRPVHRNVAFT